MKHRQLKVGMPLARYAAFKAEADRLGLSLAEFIRQRLSDGLSASPMQNSDQLIAHIETAVVRAVNTAMAANQSVAQQRDHSTLTEIVLLVRELAVERNAQILARVAQKLDSQFGKTRSKS